MPKNAAKDVILEVLGPRALEKGIELTEDTELVNDLDLDSLKTMEMLADLEDRLDVSIPLNILPNIQTLADLSRELDNLTV